MEFKIPYLLAMRDRAPKLMRDLEKHGRLKQHLDLKSREAHEMLRGILRKHKHPSLAQEREAEEIVRQTLIEFPPESDRDSPIQKEPPDDLPQGGQPKAK